MQLCRGRAVLAGLTLAVALTACGSERKAEPPAAPTTSAVRSKVIDLWVAGETKPCQGVAPMTCLQVKRNPDSEWELFYDRIAGFDYEPGYLYQLKVEETPVPNPPADASSVTLRLVDVVRKDKV
ncbi:MULTISPECIES: DUF4377 domain-containing protein [unclassified Nocardia]|uniref:DUF4377 domain-containing protein n=1 Tax=unclassified Nocardia TaxID=2637762 RepID=UPI001CE3C36D|nr:MULTISPECIES: DUF4377 domain-containing protein [unclassified Nocardia]